MRFGSSKIEMIGMGSTLWKEWNFPIAQNLSLM